MTRMIDFDSRPILYGIILAITHWPRFGSMGVRANLYHDLEHKILVAKNRLCRKGKRRGVTIDNLQYQIRWIYQQRIGRDIR